MGGFVVGAGAEVGVATGVTVGADVAGAAGVTVGADVAAALVAAGDGAIVGSWALDEHATGPNKANANRLDSKILLLATDRLRGVCFGPLIENDYWP